jgi:hypothetical protein
MPFYAFVLVLVWSFLVPLWKTGLRAAAPTPTSPPPPNKTEKPSEPGNPKPKDKRKTATPTSTQRPFYGIASTPTITLTPTISATATLIPTLTPTPTPVPGELRITMYVDANTNNLVDDGEGVENLYLTASAGDWRAEAWTKNGIAVFQIPANLYNINLFVQCPYLHWGATFAAPEADATIARGVLRMTRPDFPVYLP